MADNWLHHVHDVHSKHEARIVALPDVLRRVDHLCELNVIEQVANICQTTVVRDAWKRGQDLAVHGWIYGLKDGIVQDLGLTATSTAEVSASYKAALAAL